MVVNAKIATPLMDCLCGCLPIQPPRQMLTLSRDMAHVVLSRNESFIQLFPFVHSVSNFCFGPKMYTVWHVTFRIETHNRGPCDPLYRAEPLVKGSVGDGDPFSHAFSRVSTNVEDSVPLRAAQHGHASSVTSDMSDFYSLQSPMQDSPFTPNTEHSAFSSSGNRKSMSGQPNLPNLDSYLRDLDSLINQHMSVYEHNVAPNINSDLSPTGTNQANSIPSRTASSKIAESPSAAKIKAEPASSAGRITAPSVKRKRKEKALFSVTRRPPAKTREQHLSANRAAASKCRQQRKAWEMHLLEMSLMLQASIAASKSNIHALGAELASLKRQVWDCPGCTARYIYNLGFESKEQLQDTTIADSAMAPSDVLLT